MRSAFRGLFTAVAVMLLHSGGAAAQNFLANSTFDANVNGWSEDHDASVAWDGTIGSPGPGSARISNFSAGPSNGTGISQCAGAVTAGRLYNWGGRVYLPGGQGRTG